MKPKQDKPKPAASPKRPERAGTQNLASFLVNYHGEQKEMGDLSRRELMDFAEQKAIAIRNTTMQAAVSDARQREADALAKGPEASAKVRKIATEKNVSDWREMAMASWILEYQEVAPSPSTRREMAQKICETTKGKATPEPGTVENAIKGVKAIAKRNAKKQL